MHNTHVIYLYDIEVEHNLSTKSRFGHFYINIFRIHIREAWLI